MSNETNDVRSPCKLLPCPYCGRAARYAAEDYVDNSGEPWPFAECDACNTGAPVEFWNKRAQPADQQGEPDVLIDLVRPNPHSDGLHIRVWHNTGMLGPGEYRLYRHAQPATAKVDEQETFESVFPMPGTVRKFKGGYAATSCGAWDAHEYGQKWAGWLARAKLNGGQS